MNKIKFELEIPVHASPQMLYQYISSPSNLQEWFADKVNSRGKLYSFIWDGEEEKAELITKKSDDRIRFKWLERALDPWLDFLLVIPIAMIMPFVILTMGFSLTSRCLIVCLFTFPIIVINTRAGLRQVSTELIDMAQVFGRPAECSCGHGY